MKNDSNETKASLKHMLEVSTEMFGSRVAFKIKEGNENVCNPITYEALRDDVSALGTFLMCNGLKGKNIAIIGEDSYEWAVSYLSVVCGTGAVVPLEKKWTLSKLKRYLNATDCSGIFFSETFEDVVWELYNDGVTFLQTFICMKNKNRETQFISMERAITEGKDYIAYGNRDFFDAKITREDLAIIQFSLESQDVPKPVLLSHGNIAALLMALCDRVHVDENDIFFSTMPMSCSLKTICGLLLPLYKGASIVLHESDKNIERILGDSAMTILIDTQAVLERCVRHNCQYPMEEDEKGDIGSLRVILCSDHEGKNEILQGFKNQGIYTARVYVLPECASIAALNPNCGSVDGSIGCTLPGTECRIADPDPETGIGEICFKGSTVAIGYYNKPDYDTPIYPPITKEGWYYTGHLGTIDENNYIYICS